MLAEYEKKLRQKMKETLAALEIEKVKRSFVDSVIISAQHHLMISELKKKIVEKVNLSGDKLISYKIK